MLTITQSVHSLTEDIGGFLTTIKFTDKNKLPTTGNLFLFEKDIIPDSEIDGFLGVDPSLGKLGYFFYRPGNDFFVSGYFTPSDKGTTRLRDIVEALKKILLEFKPRVIYLENYSFDSPFKSHDLGELGGLIRILFDEYVSLHLDTKFVKIPPSSAKLIFTGNGKAKKEEMLKASELVFGVKLNSEDEADASSLCYTAMLGYTPAPPVKKVRKKKTDETPEKKRGRRKKAVRS